MVDEDDVLESLVHGLTNMTKVGFELLIRREDFVPYGILTKTMPQETDRGIRKWGLGVKLEEGVLDKIRSNRRPDKWTIEEAANRDGFFAEPLDRWDPAGNEYDDSIFLSPPHGISVTARRTPGADDSEENFRRFILPAEAEEARKNEVEVKEKETSIASLKKELVGEKKEKNWWKDRAESLGSQIEDYEKRHSTLSRRVYLQENVIEAYRLEAKATQGVSMQVEAAIGEVVETAKERGIDLARSDVERSIQSAKRMRKLREEQGALEISGDSTEVKEMRGEIEELKDKYRKMVPGEEEEAEVVES